MRLAFCAIPVVALLTLSAAADTSISTICLPGGSSAVGSYMLSSVIAQPTACTTQLVGSTECDPGYLCVEASDLGKVGGTDHLAVLADVGTADPRPDRHHDAVSDRGQVGDINHDGKVDGIDLAYILADWGTANPRSDLNHDGIVNGIDLGTLLAYWG